MLDIPANESLIQRDDSRQDSGEVSASTPTLLLMGADHAIVVPAFLWVASELVREERLSMSACLIRAGRLSSSIIFKSIRFMLLL